MPGSTVRHGRNAQLIAAVFVRHYLIAHGRHSLDQLRHANVSRFCNKFEALTLLTLDCQSMRLYMRCHRQWSLGTKASPVATEEWFYVRGDGRYGNQNSAIALDTDHKSQPFERDRRPPATRGHCSSDQRVCGLRWLPRLGSSRGAVPRTRLTLRRRLRHLEVGGVGNKLPKLPARRSKTAQEMQRIAISPTYERDRYD